MCGDAGFFASPVGVVVAFVLPVELVVVVRVEVLVGFKSDAA